MNAPRESPPAGITPGIFVLLAAPFYLNDLANIGIGDWRWWLAIDYGFVKALPLGIVAVLLASGRMAGEDLGLGRCNARTMLLVFLAAAIAGTAIDQNAYLLIEDLPGYPALGAMPTIDSAAWDWFDLTVGLLFVGVVEELVFRAAAHHVLSRYTASAVVIVGVSSVAFGLIHWSGGLHVVVVTTVIGAAFMVLYHRFRCLPSLALAHFVVNFIDFAGVIPKTLFRFV